MSRPRKYTPNTLKKAVNGYFDSISRLVPLTEKRNTGRKDSDGHVIYEEVPVLNRLGVQATVLEYLVPPEFSDTTTHARGRMRAWLEEQLLTRKDVKGIVFDLQNNYGYHDKKEIELGGRAAKAVTAASMPLEERQSVLEELMREFSENDGDA